MDVGSRAANRPASAPALWRWLALIAGTCALVLAAAGQLSAGGARVEGRDAFRPPSSEVDLGARPRESAKRPVADDERGTSRSRHGLRGALGPALIDVFPEAPERAASDVPACRTRPRPAVTPLACGLRGVLPEPRAPPVSSLPHT